MNKCAWAMMMTVLNGTAIAGDIKIGTPLVSGTESTGGDGHLERHRDLSAPQLRVIWHWLATHQSGWSAVTTPTPEPIELTLELKHSDGGTTLICLVSSLAGNRYLRIAGPDDNVYVSFAGLIKGKSATRPISSQELHGLRKLLSMP